MIITKIGGGMGNQMFQYAIGRSLSIKNNTKLGLYLEALLDRSYKSKYTFRNYDLDIFNVDAEIVDRSMIPFMQKYYNKGFVSFIIRSVRFILRNFFKIKIKGREKNFSFDNSILQLEDGVCLEGCWQNEKYFIDISDIIRKDFTLKYLLPDNIKNLMDVIKKENSLCLHIRRGDYVGDKNFENVTKEYYDKAILYISKKTKIDKIYVFSDDIKWCEDNMKFEYPVMFVGDEYSGKKAEGHHILMRSCSNFIIPNSTYAWWAAWLSDNKDKIIVVPEQWFPRNSIHYNKNIEIIPDNWIKI